MQYQEEAFFTAFFLTLFLYEILKDMREKSMNTKEKLYNFMRENSFYTVPIYLKINKT